MKTCCDCKQEKPLSEFPKRKRSKDGLYYYCKTCSCRRRKEYYARNRERLLLDLKTSAKWKAYRSALQKKRYAKIRLEVLVRYGGNPPTCACCGQREIKFLCIDHIHGGGNKHRKALGVLTITAWLKKNNFPPGYRVLCYDCNNAIAFYGTCPHAENAGDGPST